jgi:hypothetical protein
LDATSCRTMARVARSFRYGPKMSDVWLTQPWAPHRRRCWGFGIPSSARSATHDKATYHIILHFAWTFLEPADRFIATKSCSAWYLYHHLCARAALTSVPSLRTSRPPPCGPAKLPWDQSMLYACALLCFNFYYGDFGRWLSGEYTNQSRDWAKTSQTLQDVCTRSPPLDLPPADFP